MPTAPALASLVGDRWGAAIARHSPHPDSHGSIVRARFGAGGARDEAASGFRTLRDVALPALRDAQIVAPADPNATRIQTLFALLAVLDDTNLLHRGGREGLHDVQRIASRFLAGGGIADPDWHHHAVAAHHALVARRLSPGGSADLLAACLFLDLWEELVGT
jgi:triphosphoribosyl-dephospho-CoA synthase